jgi:hypothetical protein
MIGEYADDALITQQLAGRKSNGRVSGSGHRVERSQLRRPEPHALAADSAPQGQSRSTIVQLLD